MASAPQSILPLKDGHVPGPQGEVLFFTILGDCSSSDEEAGSNSSNGSALIPASPEMRYREVSLFTEILRSCGMEVLLICKRAFSCRHTGSAPAAFAECVLCPDFQSFA